jgi:hypothetical protein
LGTAGKGVQYSPALKFVGQSTHRLTSQIRGTKFVLVESRKRLRGQLS